MGKMCVTDAMMAQTRQLTRNLRGSLCLIGAHNNTSKRSEPLRATYYYYYYFYLSTYYIGSEKRQTVVRKNA